MLALPQPQPAPQVLLLTGYRVDLPTAPPFNLYNRYPPYLPPTAESMLSFRCNDDGEMELLGTKVSRKRTHANERARGGEGGGGSSNKTWGGRVGHHPSVAHGRSRLWSRISCWAPWRHASGTSHLVCATKCIGISVAAHPPRPIPVAHPSPAGAGATLST